MTDLLKRLRGRGAYRSEFHRKNLPAEANATLMAAAPDLLAALEECTELMETTHKSAISRARAAIAKSRGEA